MFFLLFIFSSTVHYRCHANDWQGKQTNGRWRCKMCSHVSKLKERFLQKVFEWTAASWKSLGSSSSRSFQRWSCHKNSWEQTRCCRLSNVDILVSSLNSKSQLLQLARRFTQVSFIFHHVLHTEISNFFLFTDIWQII